MIRLPHCLGTALFGFAILVSGCGGNIGSAIHGVQELQPEAERRNH